MKHDAFFISPDAKIIPVPDRHIVTIAGNSALFGLTDKYIKNIYKKHNETVGWEGYARNEIILELLKNDWVRLRFFLRGGTWRVQIYEKLNSKLQQNIIKFCHELGKGNIASLMNRTAPPNIEIHNTVEEVLFNGTLSTTIEYVKGIK